MNAQIWYSQYGLDAMIGDHAAQLHLQQQTAGRVLHDLHGLRVVPLQRSCACR